MSGRFAATGKALATAANTNVLSIRSSSGQRAKIEEVHIFIEAATAFTNPALFMTTVVDTAGTAVTGQKEDPGMSAATAVVSTLPTGGTLAAVAIRRGTIPSTIGAGIMWLWPAAEPLIVPLSLSLILRNDGVIGPAITWVLVWTE